jgi:hypothetical protein
MKVADNLKNVSSSAMNLKGSCTTAVIHFVKEISNKKSNKENAIEKMDPKGSAGWGSIA